MAGVDPSDGRALQRLLDELGRLPGIGPKSAQRIAYFLLEFIYTLYHVLTKYLIEQLLVHLTWYVACNLLNCLVEV